MFQKNYVLFQELKDCLPDGASKIQSYGNDVHKLSQLVAPKDYEQLIKSHAAFQKKFQDISSSVDETLRELAEKIKQWEIYDEKCNSLASWLERMEQNIKEFTLKTTVEEKVIQRDKFQVLSFFCYLNYACMCYLLKFCTF